MRQQTVWFSNGLFQAPHVLAMIREAQQPGETIRIVNSHKRGEPRGGAQSDVYEPEPEFTGWDAYIDWCLDFARRHDVQVMIPRKHVIELAAHRQRFLDAGIKLVVVANPATLELIENKAAFYEAIPQGLVAVPNFSVVRDLSQFDAAVIDLSQQHKTLCFKPTVGIAANGFRILDPTLNLRNRNETVISITVEEGRAYLSGKSSFPEVMVMPYLPGPERSVDCLGNNGKLVAGIVRRKIGETQQIIEDNPELVELARRLTEHFGLNGLYNVQFMEGPGGTQYLLEINTRMAGGIHYGALSGVSLPYWAIRLGCGTATINDVPKPRTGLVVDCATRTLVG